MAEGGFDDMEMTDRDSELRKYSDSQLQNEYDELSEKRNTLVDVSQGEDMSDGVRVEHGNVEDRMALVMSEMFRRREAEESVETLQESSFTDDADGKTVTITRDETSVEAPGVALPAPGKHSLATFKRLATGDKITFLREILGEEIRSGDGKNSEELLKRLWVDPRDGSAEFNGVRIFVRKGSGVALTEAKKKQLEVEKFNELLKKAKQEHELRERGMPMVDTAPRGSAGSSIHGLTERENRELAGVLTPGPSTIRSTRIGDDGALQIQVEHLQKTLDETNDKIGSGSVGSLQEFELRERAAGLEAAIDLTINQREEEEVREIQEEDITRLERFKEWIKDNWLGVSAFAAGVAGLITTIIIGARTAAVKGAQATKSFAKAVRDAIKKLGPWAVPLANLLYGILKGGAAVLGWLASNLWVLVLAFVWFSYDYYKERQMY